MPSASLAFAAYKRTGFPEAVALNCISEASPTKPSAPEALIVRPGMVAFANVGEAPLRGIFARSGLLNDAALIVDETTVYSLTSGGAVTALTGSIGGTGLVEIEAGLDADYNTVTRIANGSALYRVSGSSVTPEDFPTAGGAGATSVGFLSGYWLATEVGSDAVYYQEPGGTTWGALEFASAEYAPDPNVGLRVFGDLVALLGRATTEFWRVTGVAASPLEPAGGLKFNIGCRSITAAQNCAGTLIWVDDNCSVQLSEGGPPRIISDNGLAEQIRRTPAAQLSAGFFTYDQHPLYVLHLGTAATWVFDLSMNRWCRFNSLGYAYWRAQLLANIGETLLATDRTTNQIWRLDPDRRTDGADPFQAVFQAFLDVPEGAVDLANVEVDCLVGDAPRTGQGSEGGQIGLTILRDDGLTRGPVRFRNLGVTGARSVKPRWTALGEVRAPGAILEFEMSDPVGRRFSAVRFNVP